MKKLFNFYIYSSIHVSLAVLALTLVSYYYFEIPLDFRVLFFTFFASIVGYNYTKHTWVLFRKNVTKTQRSIQSVTSLSLVIAGFFFFKLNLGAQFVILLTSLFTVLYAHSVLKHKNLRSIGGVKIYVVGFCWVGITLFVPLLEADYLINSDVIVKSFQRFLLVIILILIFEIIDLKEDSPSLKTVPQTIGIKNTKLVGMILLVVFFCLEFFLSDVRISQLIINGILVLIISLFTVYADEEKSKYYTTFWVESIPILWFGLILLFR